RHGTFYYSTIPRTAGLAEASTKNGGQISGPHFERSMIRDSHQSTAYSSFFAFGFLPSLFANCGSFAKNFSGSFSNAAGQFGQQKYTFWPLYSTVCSASIGLPLTGHLT